MFSDFDTIAATGWAETDDDALLQFAIQQSLQQGGSGQGGSGGGQLADGGRAAINSAAFMNRFTTEDLELQRYVTLHIYIQHIANWCQSL